MFAPFVRVSRSHVQCSLLDGKLDRRLLYKRVRGFDFTPKTGELLCQAGNNFLGAGVKIVLKHIYGLLIVEKTD